MDVVLRPAVAADAGAIGRVFRDAALSNAGERAELLAHPEFLEWPADTLARGETTVATTPDGQVVGFATVRDGDTPELEDLFVDPAWTRRGVATALLAHLRVAAAVSGATSIQVTANPHALDFYRSAGFLDCGEVATELGTGRRMRLRVDPSTEPADRP